MHDASVHIFVYRVPALSDESREKLMKTKPTTVSVLLIPVRYKYSSVQWEPFETNTLKLRLSDVCNTNYI